LPKAAIQAIKPAMPIVFSGAGGWIRRGLAGLAALSCAVAVQAAGTCGISAIGPAFGVYNPLNAAPVTSNGSVTATCNWTSGGSTNFNIVSSYSGGSSGNPADRFMLSGGNRLYYNIYFDAAFTQIRGNGTGGTQTGAASLRVSNGQPTASATSPIYGRIPAGQNVAPGSYSDSIVVTITF
jgi:spore coat protein U-like protein